MSDQQLQRGIVELVKARRIPGLSAFDVEAHNGVVVIHGSVPSEFSRWACRECCRHVTGVRRVVDELRVGSA